MYPVYVVDHDSNARRTVSGVLGTAGVAVRPFATGQDFLEELGHLRPGCVIVDLHLRDPDALHLLLNFRERSLYWPTIVTGEATDMRLAVEAMKLGAVDFLEKPIEEGALLAAVERCSDELDRRHPLAEAKHLAEERLSLLSQREREVLRHILAGRANREIAELLGLSTRTIEMHRSNMRHKLGAGTLSEAIATAHRGGIPPSDDGP